jgi:hypothetical protein
MTTCERCGAKADPSSFDLMDYCLSCSKNLCAKCMAKGCCGKVPAESGNAAEYSDEDTGDEPQQ